MNYNKCFTIPILTVSVYFTLCCLTQIPTDINNDVEYLENCVTEPLVLYDDYCDITPFLSNAFHNLLFNNVVYNAQQHYQKIIFLIDINFYSLILLILANVYNIFTFMLSVM